MRSTRRSFYQPRWKDRLTFTLRERRGLFVLFLLIALEVGVLHYLRHDYQPLRKADWLELIRQADSLLTCSKQPYRFDEPSNDSLRTKFSKTDRTFNLHRFNPNQCTVEEWCSLGLSKRQAEAVKRYRLAGGCFKSADDLRKIRVIPAKLIDQWLPYVDIPPAREVKTAKHTLHVPEKIDINLADSVAFDRLRGIGPSMAGRIVRYRALLGGFYELDQLKEVYGFSDSLLLLIHDRLFVASNASIGKIQLNTTSVDSLRLHPYVGYRLARDIDRYRAQHAFRSVEELKKLPLVTPDYFRKLAPYLAVEN
ncbi:MAG: ComEA family DNA-binding protein [Bacteroidota bacterium]